MTGGVGGVDCRDAPVGAPPEGNAKEVTWPPCPHCICSASMWSLPRVLKGRFAKLCVPEHSNIVIEAILTPHSWSTTQLSSATKEVCAVACENGLNMYRTARMSLMSGARPCCWLRCSDRARHIYRFQFPEPTPLRRRRCEKWGSVRVQGLLSASDLSYCLGPSKPGVLGGGAIGQAPPFGESYAYGDGHPR